MNTNKIILDLQVVCKRNIYIPDKNTILKWCKSTISLFYITAELTIRFVEIQEIKKLNFIYRGENKSTNVLSFPFENKNNLFPTLLGDIVICPKVIELESYLEKKKLETHYAHIIIHGLLHLLGYDHISKNNSKRMYLLEKLIMKKLGYPNPH